MGLDTVIYVEHGEVEQGFIDHLHQAGVGGGHWPHITKCIGVRGWIEFSTGDRFWIPEWGYDTGRCHFWPQIRRALVVAREHYPQARVVYGSDASNWEEYWDYETHTYVMDELPPGRLVTDELLAEFDRAYGELIESEEQ